MTMIDGNFMEGGAPGLNLNHELGLDGLVNLDQMGGIDLFFSQPIWPESMLGQVGQSGNGGVGVRLNIPWPAKPSVFSPVDSSPRNPANLVSPCSYNTLLQFCTLFTVNLKENDLLFFGIVSIDFWALNPEIAIIRRCSIKPITVLTPTLLLLEENT
jgi:hypothetical protein